MSLWGVPLAASSKTQATSALSSAEAELYAMGMAINDALHLKSLLQEMKLSQLAKPVELTVLTDSSSGKALASKLGLARKSKHVQLRYMFIHDLLANGQLQLSKIPEGKNQATALTKHLPASTLHKLLPKLGVRTRAADSKDLLSVQYQSTQIAQIGRAQSEQSESRLCNVSNPSLPFFSVSTSRHVKNRHSKVKSSNLCISSQRFSGPASPLLVSRRLRLLNIGRSKHFRIVFFTRIAH